MEAKEISKLIASLPKSEGRIFFALFSLDGIKTVTAIRDSLSLPVKKRMKAPSMIIFLDRLVKKGLIAKKRARFVIFGEELQVIGYVIKEEVREKYVSTDISC